MKYYILAGTWGLSCFVVVTAYNSVLISFITTPVYQPLVKSIHDLVDRTDIYPIYEEGKLLDYLLNDVIEGQQAKYFESRFRMT